MHLQKFYQFIYRRQLIWYKRFILQEPPPWTDDETLQTFKFCNMYRELDKCTIYLLQKFSNISDRESLLLNIVFYRFFNFQNLYEDLQIDILETINSDSVRRLIFHFDKLHKQGRAIFNNAYIISPGNSTQSKHITIIENLVKVKFKEMVKALDSANIPEEAFEIIKTIPLVGPFLACEIWTDLTYFNFFNKGWNDNDFVNIGPGAKWGLEILFDSKLSNSQLYQSLQSLYGKQYEFLPNIHKSLGESLSWEEISYDKASSNYPFLSITNMEGALCEFRKYCNLKAGKGRRRYYK